MKFSQKMCEASLTWMLLTLSIVGYVRWHFNTLENFLVEDKFPSPVQQADQSTVISSNFSLIPSKYLTSVPWKVEIIKAPKCPTAHKIYLIKTSPLNFELRRLSRLMKGFDNCIFY